MDDKENTTPPPKRVIDEIDVSRSSIAIGGFGAPFVKGAFDVLRVTDENPDVVFGRERDRIKMTSQRADDAVTAWVESGQRLPFSRFSHESAGVVSNQRYSQSLITVQMLFERFVVEVSKFVPNNEDFLSAMGDLERASHALHTAIEFDDRRKQSVAKTASVPPVKWSPPPVVQEEEL